MGGHLLSLDHLVAPQVSNWVQLLLASPVVCWAGWPFFVRGWRSLVQRSLNMFTLIDIGTGTDVAIESAGVTLLRGDLTGILEARGLSLPTMRNIRQNLFFAFAYNAAVMPIAAGVLYPFTGLLLSPIIAAAAMSLSSVSVITNALRLQRIRL
ncbi:MAG: cation transport ATPase [Halioglobus sp.]|jgi:cation transport ATPase